MTGKGAIIIQPWMCEVGKNRKVVSLDRLENYG